MLSKVKIEKYLLNWYLLVQSQHWKHQNIVKYTHKVNDKDARKTSLTFLDAFIVNFEQIT